MNTYVITFTDRGEQLARRLAAALDGEWARCGRPLELSTWVEQHFHTGNGLVFVGAAGIAVRAIAPHVQSKTTDPAVVVVDDQGDFAVSLLSGHLGGANDLARQAASAIGAVPVITTATDRVGRFPVDQWARVQGLTVRNPEAIKSVSARILSGKTVRVFSEIPISGTAPSGVQLVEEPPFDVILSIHQTDGNALHLVPAIGVLGVGCKQGTTKETLDRVFGAFLRQNQLCREAIAGVTSIDRKASELGLLAFCAAINVPFETYSAEALKQVPGHFHHSEFVDRTVGVDNVCERSSVLGSGGPLYLPKYAADGVTMALSLRPFRPDWRYEAWQSSM